MKDFQIPLRQCSNCEHWLRASTWYDSKTQVMIAYCHKTVADHTPKIVRGSDSCKFWSKHVQPTTND